MTNKIDLGGRNAVVTGGAQGIGRAIVERFVDSGATVAIWDRDITLAKKTSADLQKRGRVAPFSVPAGNGPRLQLWLPKAEAPVFPTLLHLHLYWPLLAARLKQ